MIFYYNLQRYADKPPNPDWTRLFLGENSTGFFQEFFSNSDKEYCKSDDVVVGVGRDGEPICRNVWGRANFKICIQFSDGAGCNQQVGNETCTPCTQQFSINPNQVLPSDFGTDANQFDPDCAQLIMRKCADEPETSVAEIAFSPSDRQVSCLSAQTDAKCGPDEIQVGMNWNIDGSQNGCGGNWCIEPDLQLSTCEIRCLKYDMP